MLTPDDSPVRGRVDGDGRLISADSALADLHARAGGGEGGPLAVPQLAALARLVRRLGIPVARSVLAADGDEDLDLWVRARPEGDEVALTIGGWARRLAAGPLPSTRPAARDADFLRADADWSWDADASLRLIALSAEGMAALVADGAGPALGDPLTRLFVLDEAPSGGLPLLDALAQRRAFDEQFVTLRGTDRRFRLAGVPLLDATGQVTGFRGGGFALNGHDAVEAPKPAPAMNGAAGSAFARRIETALRRPLHRIVAAAEQIREQDAGPVRADYNAYAGDIAHAGRHLLGLIDDLADLEAVENAHLEVESEALDMADIARRAAGLLSVRADDKDMRIEQPDIAEALGAIGDFKRALQVLLNLIGNAVRFGPEGSTVRVSVEKRGDVAAAIVIDQGDGIAPENRERVFDKFERLGAREPGSGLGLYISRRLARAMGGDIVIEDGVERGGRFVFTLPAA